MVDVARFEPESLRPLRRAEFEKLAELGFFEDERVELLYGSVVRMTPIGPPHDATIQRLNKVLLPLLAGRADVRIQSSFAAGDASEPIPDVAVVPPGDYDDAHPSEAWLIVEVAESSLGRDRALKAQLYAECGVPEYWVVNLRDRQIEVHTEIVGGSYSRVTPYRKGEAIALVRFPDLQVRVDDVLR